ncbi:unnamed protein product [Calicophoron daubneyi]
MSVIREILIREQIDIVHGHSTFSDLGHETILHAQSLGVHTIFTDHSLFGFADLTSVTMNNVVECVLTLVDEVICVSHICKENTVLRTGIDPGRVYVIPNAIDSSMFIPDVSARDPNYVTIVVISRLDYRKGLDLLVTIIPPLCAIFPELRFIIGGDGPKRLDLEEIRERYQLHSQVKLVGMLKPHEVRSILIQGDIFLNTSLTEAFCIALLEAVSCGLLVISTAVGGVPEVLPREFLRLAPTRASDLARCVAETVREFICERKRTEKPGFSSPLKKRNPGNKVNSDVSDQIPPKDKDQFVSETPEQRSWRMHEWVRQAYSWPLVARRTEQVYYAALSRERLTYKRLLRGFSKHGGMKGRVLFVVALVYWVFMQFVCWMRPEERIDKVPHLRVPVEDDTEDQRYYRVPTSRPFRGKTSWIE